jgi:hypothetical protein
MLLFSYLKLQAQSTEIKPGSVFPSITTVQKNAIAIKPIGLLVFDTTLNQYTYWNGSSWVNIAGGGGGSSQWITTGTNISNLNSGNVGIGTSTPAQKLTILTPDGGIGLLQTDGTYGLSTELYPEDNIAAIGTDGAYDLVFYTAGGFSSFDFKQNGNFGINNPNPLNKFDVGVAPGFVGNELALGNGTEGMSFALTPSAAIWYTNTNFAMMPASGVGYLGIGTTNPLAPLHITSSTVMTGSGPSGGSGKFFSSTSSLANYNGLCFPSILTDGAIVTKNSIMAFVNVVASDSRVKNIVGISNNTNDLETIKKIEITDYRMKDEATWGKQTFKKVIAQQVENVYPDAIKKQTSVIPDIYSLAESVAYDAATKNLSVTLSKEYNIKIGEKIELVHPEKGNILAEVIAVSSKSFTVKNWDCATDKIFVFGREVNDFRSVDYEALSMLGISAIQQLAKEVDELKKANAIQKSEFNSRFERMEASIKMLENQSIIK